MKTKRSGIWYHFALLENKKGRCRYCQSVISIMGGSSSNLTRHLRSKHPGVPILRKLPNSQVISTSSDKEGVEPDIQLLNDDEIKQNIEIVVLDNDIERTPTEIKLEQMKQINQTSPKPTARISKIIPTPISTVRRNSFKQNSDTTSDFVREAVSSLKKIVQTSNVPEDEFSLFGKHIATQLRQLPLVKALRVQNEIHTLITKERITHCESLNNNYEQLTLQTVLHSPTSVPSDCTHSSQTNTE
ncbi:hypothetical protein ILUMI_20616 [Ignelater luminosus]|uniref:BED-type domain-containing protein n=1 Tax=Ignelater luminosus TaxID=2038154 RepID=A0A8K0CDY8_IGNLU|nr:hypothetical protein ILUMI_20616 [Ignelater luminosus]